MRRRNHGDADAAAAALASHGQYSAYDARAFGNLQILGAAKWCEGVTPSISDGTGNLIT